MAENSGAVRAPKCSYPWTQAFINANGVIGPCCANFELGNVKTDDISTVFTGQAFDRLRTDLADGRATESTEICNRCYAAKKFEEIQLDFSGQFAVGPDTERALLELDGGAHAPFAANYRKVRDHVLKGENIPLDSKPLRLEVQLGEHCDIRCIMCWQDHLRPMALKPEQLDQVRALFPTLQSIQFTGGEPTIYKDFWRLVEDFKRLAPPYAAMEVLTHANNLRDKLHLFDGIGKVYFGINVDGPTRESYEHIRSGAKWDVLMESLAALQEARKTRPHWHAGLSFLLMRSNIDLIEESFELADRFGLSWGCGMVSGEAYPVAQCNTYVRENIFRFDHLGWPKARILARLQDLKTAAARKQVGAALAVGCLDATMRQLEGVNQIHVPLALADTWLSTKDNAELSRLVLAHVSASEGRQTLKAAEVKYEAKRLANDPETRLGAALAFGEQQLNQGHAAGAEETLRPALDDAEAVPDAPDASAVRMTYGRALLALGRSAAAVPHLERAWAELTGRVGRTDSRAAIAAMELGRAKVSLAQYHGAIPPLQSALATFDKLYGKQQSSYVSLTAGELGRAYIGIGRFDDAAKMFTRALPIHRLLLGDDHSVTQQVQVELTRAEEWRAQSNLSREELGRFLSTQTVSQPVQADLHDAEALLLEGRSLLDAGKAAAAIEPLRRAYGLFSTILPDLTISFTALSASELGRAYRLAGRPFDAIPVLRKGWAMHAELLGDGHSVSRRAADDLAASYAAVGAWRESCRLLSRTHRHARATYGPTAHLTREAWIALRSAQYQASPPPVRLAWRAARRVRGTFSQGAA